GGSALVCDRVAYVANFRARLIVFLMALLDLVSRERTRRRAADRGECLALAAADLMPRERTHQTTHHGAADLVLILVAFRNCNLLVLTYLSRFAAAHRLGDRLHRHHLRKLRLGRGDRRIRCLS